MNLKYKLIFALHVLISPLFCQNSSTLKGVLYDSTNHEIISYAPITFLKGFTIINQELSDNDGSFEIKVQLEEKDTIQILINSFGYKEQSIFVTQNNIKEKYAIYLSPQKFDLSTINIKAREYAIKERGDTTNYNLEKFIDSTETSIEDVLKKLPGFKISKEGKISVNGKDIEKILIEGDDLTGDNYSMLTKTGKPRILSNVQTINNYNNNPLLAKTFDSDKIIVNLELKDDYKNNLSGNISIGLGYGEDIKTANTANVFSLSKKFKMLFLGDINNVGYIKNSDFEYSESSLFGTDIQKHRINQDGSQINHIGSLHGVSNTYIDGKFANLGMLSFIVPVSPNSKLKVITNGVLEKNELEKNDISDYFGIDMPYKKEALIRDSEQQKAVNVLVNFTNFNVDKNVYINAIAIAESGKKQESNISERITPNQTKSNSNRNIELNSFYTGLEISKRMSDKTVGIATFFFGLDSKKDIMNSQYEFYESSTFFKEKFQRLKQTTPDNKQRIGFDLLVLSKISDKVNIQYNIGLKNDHYQNNPVGLGFNSQKPVSISEINGNQDLSISKFYINATISYILSNKSTLKGKIGNSLNTYFGKNYNIPKLVLQMNNKINRYFSLSSEYEFHKIEMPVNILNTGNSLVDYNTISEGISIVEIGDQHKISTLLNIKNRDVGFYSMINLIYELKDNYYQPQYDLSADWFIENYFLARNAGVMGAELSLDKMFYDLKSRVKVTSTYSNSSYESIFNSEKFNNVDILNTLEFNYGSAFIKSPFNFNLFYTTQWFEYKNQFGSNKFSIKTFTLRGVFKLKKNFKITVDIANREIDSGNDINSFLSGNLELQWFYDIKNYKGISLSIENIFGQRELTNLFQNSSSLFKNSIALQKPYFLLSTDFDF